MKKLSVLLLPLIAMVGIAVFATRHTAGSLCESKKGIAAIGQMRYAVQLAINPAEWSQGLSGRPGLPLDEGMLFLFPNAAKRSFWMKDMFFPIDIIWIDSDWNVVGVVPHATPETYPKTFTSPAPISRVLEIASVGELGGPIHIGDHLEFNCL